MEKEFLHIFKANSEQHGTFVEVFAIGKAGRKGKPIPHKIPSLSDLARDRQLFLREFERLSSAAKGKARTKRSCEKTSTHIDGSESEDDFGEALQEMMKEVGNNWRERRGPIPDVGRNGHRETLLIKMDENENEDEEETLSSAAKGNANGEITKRSCVKIITHSEDSESEDDFGEALQEMMKEVGNNWRERRGPIPGNPLSSQNNVLKIMGGDLSVLGMGGIGETTIQNNGITVNYTIGTLKMTNHHHYYKQERDEDD